jgi:hypothetical protein
MAISRLRCSSVGANVAFGHAQRPEHVLLKVRGQILPRHRLDHLP